MKTWPNPSQQRLLVIDSFPGACILDGGMFRPSALQPRKSHQAPRDQQGPKPPTFRSPNTTPRNPPPPVNPHHASTASLLLTRCRPPPPPPLVWLMDSFLFEMPTLQQSSTRGTQVFRIMKIPWKSSVKRSNYGNSHLQRFSPLRLGETLWNLRKRTKKQQKF